MSLVGNQVSRADLHRLVFGRELLPGADLPTAINDPAPVPMVAGEVGIEFEIDMGAGYVSRPQLFAVGGKVLVVTHQGHTKFDEIGVGDTCRAVIAEGGDCLAMEMPNEGQYSAGFTHDNTWQAGFPSPLYPFCFPVRVAINQAVAMKEAAGERYHAIYVTGVSGGGHMVPVSMALFGDISRGVGFAGSLPRERWTQQPNKDSEQCDWDLYASYPSLYLLSADAQGRELHLVHNLTDPCCFGQPGDDYEARYIRPLSGLAEGRIYYREINDPEHRISPDGIDYLMMAFGLRAGWPPDESPPPPPPPPAGEIIDDADPQFSAVGPAWTDAPGDGYGGSTHHHPATPPGAVATWTYGVKPAGSYALTVHWYRHPNRATNTPVRVLEDGTERLSVLLDQQTGPRGLVSQAFPGVVLDGSGAVVVEMSNAGVDGYIIADAMELSLE